MDGLFPVAFFGGSIGGGELLLILLVALLLFGSKNLPKIARSMGRALEEFKRSAREVSDEIMHSDREPPRTPPAPQPNPPEEEKPHGPDVAP